MFGSGTGNNSKNRVVSTRGYSSGPGPDIWFIPVRYITMSWYTSWYTWDKFCCPDIPAIYSDVLIYNLSKIYWQRDVVLKILKLTILRMPIPEIWAVLPAPKIKFTLCSMTSSVQLVAASQWVQITPWQRPKPQHRLKQDTFCNMRHVGELARSMNECVIVETP